MKPLQLIYAPHPIFQKKSKIVDDINNDIKNLISNLYATMEFEKAVGMAANMVGELKRIIVVNLAENGVSAPKAYINPEIVWRSQEQQTHTEASICYPGIDAKITRAKEIKVRYQTLDGKVEEEQATDFRATVIQHEVDYLDGIVYLDYLSKMKRDMLLKKMNKYIKLHPPHIHTSSCSH